MTRTWIAVGTALALIGLLLGLPAPRRTATAVAGPSVSVSPAGLTLATVWPHARSFPIPAVLPDGSTYTPTLILDPQMSVGTVASADGRRTDLDEVPAAGSPRVLQSQLVSGGGSFDGLTVTSTQLYWMHTLPDANGQGHVSLWTAPRAGGSPRQLTANVGTPNFYGSAYDVQPVADRLYWAATRPGQPDQTEIRSIPQSGGTVSVQVIPGAWAMSTWPWLVTAPSATGQPTQLRNLTTGQTITVKAPANKQVTCSPAWCRLLPDTNSLTPTATDLVRPDGTDLQPIGDPNSAAIVADVALLDRYEVLMTILTGTGPIAISKLTLYDIAHRRAVLISAAATNIAASGNYLWWSTGDNETLAWHGLDLRTLT
jgi:hypothetical protein